MIVDAADRHYFFRGNDQYLGGRIGRALGPEADGAVIQSAADHVLRKRSGLSSRFTSFTTEVKIARMFTSSEDNRFVIKIESFELRRLETLDHLRLWDPNQVFDTLIQATAKLAKQASSVRSAMKRNREILIEGQVPESLIESVR